MERILARLDAIELSLKGPERSSTYPRQWPPPDTTYPRQWPPPDPNCRNFARAPTHMHTEENRTMHRRPPVFSSWDRPLLEFEEPELYPQQARWENSSRHDRRGHMHVDLQRGMKIEPSYDRSSWSSWEPSSVRSSSYTYNDYRYNNDFYAYGDRPPYCTSTEKPRGMQPRPQPYVSSWDSPHHTHTSIPSPTSSPSSQPHVVRESERAAPTPIHVSVAEKAERAKRRLCFYCPEKWVQGHVCQTKLLAYFEDDDFVEPNQDDDCANDEENNDAQPKPKGLTEPGVITVPELHGAGVEVPDAEAELHAEPVVEGLKLAAQPCLIASSFAFVFLSRELLQKLPNSGNLRCGIEGKHLEGNFVLGGSMERRWTVVDSIGLTHLIGHVFDPGGDNSPQCAFCSTSSRSSWFVATWYPP